RALEFVAERVPKPRPSRVRKRKEAMRNRQSYLDRLAAAVASRAYHKTWWGRTLGWLLAMMMVVNTATLGGAAIDAFAQTAPPSTTTTKPDGTGTTTT